MTKTRKHNLSANYASVKNVNALIENRNKTLTSTTRRDLAQVIYEEVPLVDPTIPKLFVELFFETIRDELIAGGEVKLSGFGSFKTVHKNARPGRNLHTGETVTISARRVVRFRPSRKLRIATYGEEINI